jgi:hypothetical protein
MCHGHENLQEWELSQKHNKKKKSQKCKPKSNPRLETQICRQKYDIC